MFSYFAVALIAGIIATLEILLRYPESSRRLAKEWPAWTYVGIHVVASLGALWLLSDYVWPLESPEVDKGQTVARIGVAAFGSVAVLRSTVFQARVGTRQIDVGPHAMIEALLDVTDRNMDRRHAEYRSATVAGIMQEVTFEKARVSLPTHCFNAMRSVSDQEQEAVQSRVDYIARVKAMPEPAKSLTLGFLLLDIVGEDLLRQAVEDLGESIR